MKFSAGSFLMLIAASLGGYTMRGQSIPVASRLTLDVGAGYTAVRANEGPGLCGCFYMQGGSGEVTLTNSSGISFVTNFGYTTASSILGTDQRLSLFTLMEGARLHLGQNTKLSPFGEALVGVSHTTSNYEIYKSNTRTGLMFGGGFDVRLGNRVAFRPIEADYLFTSHPNGVNSIQSQLRLTTGVILHIGSARQLDR